MTNYVYKDNKYSAYYAVLPDKSAAKASIYTAI